MRMALVTQPPPREFQLLEQKQEQQDLVRGLKARRAWAEQALLEEYTGTVERVITRILGYHNDLDDLVQEVFIRALERVDDVHDPAGLKSWLGAFAVFVAREALRRRRRRRWLILMPAEEVPELPAGSTPPEVRAATRALYALLDKMDPDLRIVFALRVIDGLELSEVAELTDVSLSTVKRRVQQAKSWFLTRARRDPKLREWAGGEA